MRRARELVPEINLTSDVIVGHPAEGRDDFERTLDAVREAGFSKVHVFPYSRRPGTADAAADPVAPAEKRWRSAQLRRLSDAQGAAHRARLVGRRALVLVEGDDGRGYGDDYTPFIVPGAPPGEVVSAVGVEPGADAVIATLCA
jgi:threonylcarbamoyladenosine tRNA methylthiotransferase MtaB